MANFSQLWRRQAPQYAVVLGAHGGLGNAFVHEIKQRFPACTVLPVYHRNLPEHDVASLCVDVCDDDSISHFAQRLSQHCPRIDLLVNCIGILHREDIQPEKSLRQVNRHSLQTLMNVNAIGPLLVIKALAPLFDKRRPALIASLSARVGSISDNQLGGWHAYRASKAASNMLLKNLAQEWRRSHPQTLIAMLQPGTVNTRLSQPFQKNVPQLLTPEHSAHALLDQLLLLSAEQSGSFIDWRGKMIAF